MENGSIISKHCSEQILPRISRVASLLYIFSFVRTLQFMWSVKKKKISLTYFIMPIFLSFLVKKIFNCLKILEHYSWVGSEKLIILNLQFNIFNWNSSMSKDNFLKLNVHISNNSDFFQNIDHNRKSWKLQLWNE